MEQNVALDLARREAEMAIRARNDFLAVMNHEMRTPMNAIIALSSLLLETELTPEQRLMVETVLKSSNLLATLINDVLDLSKLEDGSLELEIRAFNLHAVFKEVTILFFLGFLCLYAYFICLKFCVGLTGDGFHQTNCSYQESIYVGYVSTRFAIMCYWRRKEANANYSEYLWQCC
jgi:hypothetical protein